MLIKFPKRIKSAKKNPIIDFYEKCLLELTSSSNLDNVQVTAFTVNPKDYTKLKKLLKIYIKKNYPLLNARKISFEIGMVMLDIGPRVSKTVQEGNVSVDKDCLYGIH